MTLRRANSGLAFKLSELPSDIVAFAAMNISPRILSVTTRIVILGAGGFGRELHDWLIQFRDSPGDDNSIKLLGFLDDGNPDKGVLDRIGVSHLGPISSLRDLDAMYYVAVGSPDTRRQIVARCDELGATAGPALIHPSVILGSDIELGPGSIVCPMTVLTTNIRIGSHVQLHVATTLGHDVTIEDFVTVSPGVTISGNVTIENGALIGTQASINQGLTVGTGATIGAGAAVITDIPAGITAVGVPARAR